MAGKDHLQPQAESVEVEEFQYAQPQRNKKYCTYYTYIYYEFMQMYCVFKMQRNDRIEDALLHSFRYFMNDY